MNRPYLQYAHLSATSPRAADWQTVFGSLIAPITNARAPFRLSICGELRAAYLIALDELTPLQRGRLIYHLAVKFGIPIAEVATTIDQVGVPLLAEDVTGIVAARLPAPVEDKEKYDDLP